MTSQIRGLDQAVRNGNDAISMIQTADGAMVEVTNMLQRMREIAVQGASDTNTATDRDALDIEFQSLEDQIQAISENTQWNGTNILDGQLGQVDFQIGANASQTISVTFEDLNTAYNSSASATKSSAGVFTTLEGSTASKDLETLDLQNKANASAAITQVDKALEKINAHRATLGSTINRIEYAVDNLANVSQNASASRSRVQDANYATESTELARTQIIQQAGTAMLAQANQQSQSVLALLK
jgi:flagellin